MENRIEKLISHYFNEKYSEFDKFEFNHHTLYNPHTFRPEGKLIFSYDSTSIFSVQLDGNSLPIWQSLQFSISITRPAEGMFNLTSTECRQLLYKCIKETSQKCYQNYIMNLYSLSIDN
jgi:hypothetical protein